VARGAAIAAVTCSPNNLDLFYMGNNAQATGRILTSSWQGRSWETLDLGGPAGGVGIPGGLIAATARTSNNLDIFTPAVELFTPGYFALSTSYWSTGATGWATYQAD
jgi:hypothetical protein